MFDQVFTLFPSLILSSVAPCDCVYQYTGPWCKFHHSMSIKVEVTMSKFKVINAKSYEDRYNLNPSSSDVK